MSLSFKLFRLQQIDTSIGKGRARLKEIDRLLADDSRIQNSQQRLELAKNKRYVADKNLRIAEQNVKEQRHKIERSETTLYSGKIANPKELQDLELESESLKRYLTTLEDHQLEAMFAFDEAEVNLIETSDLHTSVLAQVEKEKDALSAEKMDLIGELERQVSERQAAAANIDPVDIQLYETLRQQKNGIAVARVVDKTCAACGSTLTASTFGSAQVPTKLTRCSTCGRILYAG